MTTTSFPSLHRCLPPTYSSNPSSSIPPQSFHLRNDIKHVATRRSRYRSRFRNLKLNRIFLSFEASIGRIFYQESTCQCCSCSFGSSNEGSGIHVFESRVCNLSISRNKRTIDLFVTFGAECDVEALDSGEVLLDDVEEEPSSRANSVTAYNIEVGKAGLFPSVIEKGSGVGLHYLEEQDKDVYSKQILELSRSNKRRSALELFRSMEAVRREPNLHACNSLLSCLLRNDMLDDALGVFEYMKNKRIISGHSFSLVFKAVAVARGIDEAIKMFMDTVRISDHEKDFDVVVYNTIISICAKVDDWFQMERVWFLMKENGRIGTTVTYNILVCTFVRCGQYELSIAAYSEMLQNGIKPGVDSMHAIIGACTKEGKWELAVSVYESMLASGMKPNLIAFNALINLLGRSGKVEAAFRVYNKMELFGHTPDAHTWNALIGALYTANHCGSALELFHRIRVQQKVKLNTKLYNTALMCCQRLRLWDKSLQLLWLMEQSGLTVTTASYNLAIGTCEVARKPNIALQVFEHMVHQKCPADTFTYLSLARSCIWGSLWYEVDAILDLTSNVSLYNAIIQGMCLRGKFGAAKRLYAKMRDIGLVPDGKTRAMMLQRLTRDSP